MSKGIRSFTGGFMNIPPKCEWDVTSCTSRGTIWTVLDKTTGKYHTVCSNHLATVMHPDHTFVIYKAKDYSVHAGHDLPTSDKKKASKQ